MSVDSFMVHPCVISGLSGGILTYEVGKADRITAFSNSVEGIVAIG